MFSALRPGSYMPVKINIFQKIFLVIFGLLLSIILLEAGLRLCGFALLAVQGHKNSVAVKKAGAYRILCLGESMTAGQYPALLEAVLNQSAVKARFTVIDEGRAGATTTEILTRLEYYLDEYHPDMVVAMMGMSDVGTAHLLYESPSASTTVLFFNHFKLYKLIRNIFRITYKAEGWVVPPEGELVPYVPQGPAGRAQNPDRVASGVSTRSQEQQNYGAMQAPQVQLRLQLAEKTAKQELESNPNDYSAQLQLGEIYLAQGRYQAAQEQFKKAIRLQPENSDENYALGMIYVRKSQLLLAEEQFKKSLKLRPGNDETYHQLGLIYMQQRQFQQAKVQFKKALDLNPANFREHLELANLYTVMRQFDLAAEQYNKALKLNIENDRVLRLLGQTYQRMRKLQPAEEHYKKALELSPDNYEGYLLLGGLYLQTSRLAQAQAQFKKILQLDPENAAGNFALGQVYIRTGRFQQAEEQLSKAMQLDPVNFNKHMSVGELYMVHGQFELADKHYKEAIRATPEDDKLYCFLGVQYSQAGQFQKAAQYYKSALRLNPGNHRAYLGLQFLAEYKGQPQLPDKTYYGEASRMYSNGVNAETAGNYKALKAILDKRKIRLVVVQYPMRSLEPLKKIFAGQPAGVIFVDNERSFQLAVAAQGYAAIFEDLSCGNFGHCTPKGNQLLAENIAKEILKEVFAR